MTTLIEIGIQPPSKNLGKHAITKLPSTRTKPTTSAIDAARFQCKTRVITT